MLRVFIGHDPRQPISYNILQHSIVARASQPVTITPLCLPTLPITRAGLTPFTFTRYLVPWLMHYGLRNYDDPDSSSLDAWALFLDSDMLFLGDVADLFKLADPAAAVMVVKNPKQFEWASAMLWNCGHEANTVLTPEWVQDEANNPFKFSWLEGGRESPLIGALPSEWNHLVGYDPPRNDARLIHYTMGVPAFEETRMCEYAEAWLQEHHMLNGAVPWIQLMGQSVHASHLPDGRVLPLFHPDVAAHAAAAAMEQGA